MFWCNEKNCYFSNIDVENSLKGKSLSRLIKSINFYKKSKRRSRCEERLSYLIDNIRCYSDFLVNIEYCKKVKKIPMYYYYKCKYKVPVNTLVKVLRNPNNFAVSLMRKREIKKYDRLCPIHCKSYPSIKNKAKLHLYSRDYVWDVIERGLIYHNIKYFRQSKIQNRASVGKPYRLWCKDTFGCRLSYLKETSLRRYHYDFVSIFEANRIVYLPLFGNLENSAPFEYLS